MQISLVVFYLLKKRARKMTVYVKQVISRHPKLENLYILKYIIYINI